MNSSEEVKNEEVLTKEDYNNIPIHYCKNCGSLAIMVMSAPLRDYCDKCGSTETGKASIYAWLNLQKSRYKPVTNKRLVYKL